MNINIGITGSPEFVSQFGKKGTESDITMYNFRKDEDTITFLQPTRYPAKLSSLFFVLDQSDLIIMEISEINAALGELIVAIEAAAIAKGYIYLTNYLQPDQIIPLLKGTVLENYTFTTLPPPELKEELLQSYEQFEDGRSTIVPIDHHFNVKGIGPVILGIVRSGTVKKHQKLILHPLGKEVLVRSIQTHDKDVDSAGIGERVGLAMKGIETQDLDRGMVMAEGTSEIKSEEKLKLRLEVNPFWKLPLEADMVLHLSTHMQMKPGRIHSIESTNPNNNINDNPHINNYNNKNYKNNHMNAVPQKDRIITMHFDRPLVYQPGSPIFVSYLEGGNLRVIGRGTVIEA